VNLGQRKLTGGGGQDSKDGGRENASNPVANGEGTGSHIGGIASHDGGGKTPWSPEYQRSEGKGGERTAGRRAVPIPLNEKQ